MSLKNNTNKQKSVERIIPITIEKDETKTITSSTENAQPSTSRTLVTDYSEDSNKDELEFDDIQKSVNMLSLSTSNEEEVIDETTVEVPPRTLPSTNVPEKIVIVFDRASDEDDCTWFEMSFGKRYPTIVMLCRALKMFLYNKSAIDPRHQFALMFLNEHTANWVQDFTNSPQDIIGALQNIKSCKPEDIFDLNVVFDLIREKVVLSTSEDKRFIPPPYVVRIIFMYARSYSLPCLTKTKEVEELLNSPYVTFDVVMTHDPPSAANHCRAIFERLQEIDKKGFNYSFSVSRNASDLHLAMAKILSHPLQRPHQKYANYNISSLVIN